MMMIGKGWGNQSTPPHKHTNAPSLLFFALIMVLLANNYDHNPSQHLPHFSCDNDADDSLDETDSLIGFIVAVGPLHCGDSWGASPKSHFSIRTKIIQTHDTTTSSGSSSSKTTITTTHHRNDNDDCCLLLYDPEDHLDYASNNGEDKIEFMGRNDLLSCSITWLDDEDLDHEDVDEDEDDRSNYCSCSSCNVSRNDSSNKTREDDEEEEEEEEEGRGGREESDRGDENFSWFHRSNEIIEEEHHCDDDSAAFLLEEMGYISPLATFGKSRRCTAKQAHHLKKDQHFAKPAFAYDMNNTVREVLDGSGHTKTLIGTSINTHNLNDDSCAVILHNDPNNNHSNNDMAALWDEALTEAYGWKHPI